MNGLLEQWGYVVKNTAKDGTETITYPITYEGIPSFVGAWIINRYTRFNIINISNTSATIRCTDTYTSGYTWKSIGF